MTDIPHIMQCFADYIQQPLASLDQYMQKRVHSDIDLVQKISQYIIASGGKRLRPMVLIAFARMLEVEPSVYYPMAAMIEYIHTATLLHDDVVDESVLRRNQATANAVFGNAPSVLVGDFLYSRAFQVLVGLGRLDMMDVMANATNVIAQGEVQQLMNIGNINLSQEEYFATIHAKTSALFSAASELAILASPLGAQSQLRQAAKHYGHHLGCAFQVMDDYLDYMGESNTMGKNIGDDLQEGKMTLPLIYLHEDAQHRALIERTITHKDASDIAHLIQIVQSSDAIIRTQACAQAFAKQAKQALEVFPSNLHRSILYDIADLAVMRQV